MISRKLIGLTKKDVRYLLGDEFNGIHSDIWKYYVGKKPGFRPFSKRNIYIIFQDGIAVDVSKS